MSIIKSIINKSNFHKLSNYFYTFLTLIFNYYKSKIKIYFILKNHNEKKIISKKKNDKTLLIPKFDSQIKSKTYLKLDTRTKVIKI